MSKVYTDPQHYIDIADAIRYKNGTQNTYKPAQMPAAIRAIETDPTIQSLTVSRNGIFTPPTGVDGYAPVTVNVPVSGGSTLYLHFPRLCAGDSRMDFHSDCELAVGLSISDTEADEEFLTIVRTGELDGYVTMDTALLTAGDSLEFKLLSAGYANNNGDSDKAVIPVNALQFSDLYEVPTETVWCYRKVLYRMTVVRYHTKTDSGTDTMTFTGSFRRVGGLSASDCSSVTLNGDSVVTAGALTMKVNNRDSSMYSSWKEEGTVQGLHFMKVRWEGMSVYSSTTPDQEYEIIFLGNGDVMFHLIKKGTSSGTTTFYGTSFTLDETTPDVSFYRSEYYGTSWTVLYESYNISHHSAEADLVWHSRIWNTEYSNITSGLHLVHNESHDDDTVSYNFALGFTWHGATYLNASGNSWITLENISESIKMHQRDSKMWYLYADYARLPALDGLQALHITWGGASAYNGSVDRWWSLWLFENGDAMIYVSSVGSNTGTSSFLGQSYTATDNQLVSFYYDPSTSAYDIRYEKYTLEHHIEEET